MKPSLSASEHLERLRLELARKSTPKAKGQGLSRTTRVNPVNRQRKAKRNAACFGPQARLCRTLPCVACGRRPPSDPHHVLSRGAGGKDADTCSLCRRCHDILGSIGQETFEKRLGVSLEVCASYTGDQLRQHDCLLFPESVGLTIRCHVCHAGINAEDVQS